jgi:hypothetical protein
MARPILASASRIRALAVFRRTVASATPIGKRLVHMIAELRSRRISYFCSRAVHRFAVLPESGHRHEIVPQLPLSGPDCRDRSGANGVTFFRAIFRVLGGSLVDNPVSRQKAS